MTPTAQDNELRELVSSAMYDTDYKQVTEDSEYFDQAAVDAVVELIIADRKRVELEARIDELEQVYPQLQKHRGVSGEGNYYYDDRIAALKAQQEE